jgi:hypothetical protein
MSLSKLSQWPERGPDVLSPPEPTRPDASGILPGPIDPLEARRGYSWLEPPPTSFTAAQLNERRIRMRKIVSVVLTVAVMLLLAAVARTAARSHQTKGLAQPSDTSERALASAVDTAPQPAAPSPTVSAISTTKSVASPSPTAIEARRHKAEQSRKMKKMSRAKLHSS